jgi:hypothetical protein
MFGRMQAGLSPTDDQWRTLFATPAYRFLNGTQNMEPLFRAGWPVVFMPGQAEARKQLLAKRPVFAAFLDYFGKIPARHAELRACQSALERHALIEEAAALARVWLPDTDPAVFQYPRVAIAIADPDAKVHGDLIVLDLQLACDLGELLARLLAHETHHVFAARLSKLQPLADAAIPEAPLVQAIRQLSMEGIADLIDKTQFLAREDPLAAQYRTAYAESAAIVRRVDALLTEIALDPSKTALNAKAVWASLPMAGHPTGYYMARLVLQISGKPPLFDAIRNPFAFLRAYNAAARTVAALGEDVPLFSPSAMAVLDGLESRHIR